MAPLLLLLAMLAAPPGADGFRWEQEDERLEFSYRWPAEADAIPALRAELRRRLDADLAEATDVAAESETMAREGGYPFRSHDFVKVWETAGQTPRLMSLEAEVSTYRGGAHGNLGFSALLWDRAEAEAVDAASLLGLAALARLTPRFCDSLDAEREERRGEPVRRDPDDLFAACPPLADQVLAFADADRDGRLDSLRVLIPPYVAGPYVEGPYLIEVAFESADLGGMASEYRISFEPPG